MQPNPTTSDLMGDLIRGPGRRPQQDNNPTDTDPEAEDDLTRIGTSLGCIDTQALRTLVADDTLAGAALRSRIAAVLQQHPVLAPDFNPNARHAQPIDAGNHGDLPPDPHAEINKALRRR